MKVTDNERVKKVSKEKIKAAKCLFEKMPGWRNAVETLDEIKGFHGGFGRLECFIKTAAVDSLYSTNLYDVGLMAGHVTKVFETIDYKTLIRTKSGCVDLVNKISELSYPDDKIKWHVSFASKLCHFFVCNNFPILDTYAIAALKRHDESFRDSSKDMRYRDFVCSIEQVRDLSNCSIRELDCYLWLKGMLMAFDSKPEAKLSREFKNTAVGNDIDVKTLRSDQ